MKPSLLPARSLGARAPSRGDVEELSELVVRWLRAHRKPAEEREPQTPLVYVTYRALPQTPTAR